MIAAAAATPGFWGWSVSPPLGLLIAAGLLYWLGGRGTVSPPRRRRERRWRASCFYAALLVLAIALNSPIDALSEQLFWAHMVQHVLLLVLAPPLIVLARPWVRLWRSLPLGTRRSVGRSLALGNRMAPARRITRTLGRPLPSFLLFSVVLLGWHVPSLFDATLRSQALHGLEHSLFFSTAVLFWKQVIDSPPLRAIAASALRVAYLVAAMIVSWLLAVVLALTSHPLYDVYAHEASRPGGISALGDQQIAAGIMWVPGSVTFLIVLFVYVHRWLTPPEVRAKPSRLAGEH